MTGRLPRSTPSSLVDYAVSLLLNPVRRSSMLVVVAYAAGFCGVVLSLFGNPANPQSAYGAAGILLMGISFLCLFGLSISVLNVAPDADH